MTRFNPHAPMPQTPGPVVRDGVVPGDTLNLQNAKIVQGRETGYQIELEKPLTVVRPRPDGNYLDSVRYLDLVEGTPPRPNERTTGMRVDVVSFGLIGRPNPRDEQTSVTVKMTGRRGATQKEWIF
jgi:hypothetical protein